MPGNENSGNPHPVQNEEFLAKAKLTQFGGEKANPSHYELKDAAKPWSVRSNLRYLAAQEIDEDNFQAEIKRLRKPAGGGKATIARCIAARMIEKVHAKMPAELVDKLIDNIEGKLVQPTTELPPPVKYNFDNMTDEEALAAYEELKNG